MSSSNGSNAFSTPLASPRSGRPLALPRKRSPARRGHWWDAGREAPTPARERPLRAHSQTCSAAHRRRPRQGVNVACNTLRIHLRKGSNPMAPTGDLASARELFDPAAADLQVGRDLGADPGKQVRGVAFGENTPELDDLIRAFDEIASALPPVNDFAIRDRPWDNDQIAQARFDAQELGELEVITGTERAIDGPGREIAEYRHRLHLARRSIVRTQVEEVVAEVDALLDRVRLLKGVASWPGSPQWAS